MERVGQWRLSAFGLKAIKQLYTRERWASISQFCTQKGISRSAYYAIAERGDKWFEKGTIEAFLKIIGINDTTNDKYYEHKDSTKLTNNLPLPLTSFIGRENEKARVIDLLEKTRILTLTGTGGCGKTRLALQVAAEVLEQYSDGVWLVELAPLTDSSLVPQIVASVLGVKEAPGAPIIKRLTAVLKEKQILLLLDNCEHVLEASAQFAECLLRSCPGVRLLLSSREALGITGESIYRVPSLSLPDLKQPPTPQILSQSEAVLLFVKRASAVMTDFTITPQNASTLALVCHRLDGIPLAIELAAVRLRSMTLEELSKHLDDRFRILTMGSTTALPRHKTLRALVDWSYDLLAENQKRLLARLSIFAGGWRLEAAEIVCSGEAIEAWEVWDLLTALVDKSLVVAEAQGDTTRYHLLETVRQYGHDRLLETQEVERVGGKYRNHLLSWAEEARSHLMGPEENAWLKRLDEEHANLLAALVWCQTNSNPEYHLRLATILYRYWVLRGYLSEGRTHLEAALQCSTTPPMLRAKALNVAGVLARLQSDYTMARIHHEESLALFRQIDDQTAIAGVLNNLGLVARELGDFETAHAHFEEALALYEGTDAKPGIAAVLENLGWMARHTGDLEAASDYYQRSMETEKALDNQPGVAESLNSLGTVALSRCEYDEACRLFEQSLAIQREIGYRLGEAHPLNNLGIVARHHGELGKAQLLHEAALSIWKEAGDRSEMAAALNNLGLVARKGGNHVQARNFYEQSIAIKREIGDRIGTSHGLHNMAGLLEDQGDYSGAFALYRESLALDLASGQQAGTASSMEDIGGLLLKRGELEFAVRLFGAAETLRAKIGCPLPEGERASLNQNIAMAKANLAEEIFIKAMENGRLLPLEDTIGIALEEFFETLDSQSVSILPVCEGIRSESRETREK